MSNWTNIQRINTVPPAVAVEERERERVAIRFNAKVGQQSYNGSIWSLPAAAVEVREGGAGNEGRVFLFS